MARERPSQLMLLSNFTAFMDVLYMEQEEGGSASP
jgi:hypothetical protein